MKKGLSFLMIGILFVFHFAYAQTNLPIGCYSNTSKRSAHDKAVAKQIRKAFSGNVAVTNCNYYENKEDYFTYTFYAQNARYVIKCPNSLVELGANSGETCLFSKSD